MGQAFDWKNPDYAAVYTERSKRLNYLQAHPAHVPGAKEFYRTHPAQFISDWGRTFDPRHAEIGLPTVIPFVLFPKQEQFIDWLHQRWQNREDGLCEKSRDMGVTWLCVAFAVWMWLFHPGTVVGFGSRKEEYVDNAADPKSIFWKAREFIRRLPHQFRPAGWDEKKHSAHMRLTNPENGAAIVGEAGDNIGRGNRTSIYFKDESAFYEHADMIEASLSQTSNCKIDVSTPNGAGNAFYRKRHSGKIPVFVFDWKDDPRKGREWYEAQVAKIDDPVIVAQEIDRDYESSVSDVYIEGELVRAAQARGPAEVVPMGGLRVGIDVARFGDDKTVISFRRGRVLLKQVVLAKLDVAQVAGRAKAEIDAYKEKPEQIAVDVIGVGAGVADMMRGWYPKGCVVDVNSAERMKNGLDYNLRALMYREMREWLKTASIPMDHELRSDLTALKHYYKGGEMLIEDKKEAKARGIKSPDKSDSLALTFAKPTKEKYTPPPVTPYIPRDPGMGS